MGKIFEFMPFKQIEKMFELEAIQNLKIVFEFLE
jgi:hypothetical protein